MPDSNPPMNPAEHAALPDGCPHREGEECPVVEHERHNRRRASDRLPASAMRIIMALIGVIGAGSGGYIFRDKVMAAPPSMTSEAVDHQARQQIEIMKVEINGKLMLITQQQEQTNERLRELIELSRESRSSRRRTPETDPQ